MPEGPQMVVSPDVVVRGGRVTVSVVGERDGVRSLRAELVLTERKKIANLYRRTHERVLATAEVAASASSVELAVPDWAPDTYTGESIDSDYCVRVVGDRAGLDLERVETIRVAGGAMVPYVDGHWSLLRSIPTTKRGGVLTGPTPRGPLWVPLGLLLVVGAVVLVGYVIDSPLTMAIAATTGLLPLMFLFEFLKASPLDLSDVVIEPPAEPLRLGESARVTVTNPRNLRLEIGVQAIELAITKSDNSYSTHTEVIAERFEPLTGPTATVYTLDGEPSGYAGEEIALHWVIVARATEHTSRMGRLPWFGVPIAVVA